MQLSPRTVAILENYAKFNDGIVFKPGNIIRTLDKDGKDVFAEAKIEDTFEKQFAISDLGQFLSILSSFEKPTIKFKEKTLTVSEGKRTVQYTYGFEDSIISPPDKPINMPKSIATFKMTGADLRSLTKVASVLNVPHVAIAGDLGQLVLRSFDAKNPTTNVYNHKLESDHVDDFIVVFDKDKFNKLMPEDYTVTVGKGVVKFNGKDLSYWVAPIDKYSFYGK